MHNNRYRAADQWHTHSTRAPLARSIAAGAFVVAAWIATLALYLALFGGE